MLIVYGVSCLFTSFCFPEFVDSIKNQDGAQHEAEPYDDETE